MLTDAARRRAYDLSGDAALVDLEIDLDAMMAEVFEAGGLFDQVGALRGDVCMGHLHNSNRPSPCTQIWHQTTPSTRDDMLLRCSSLARTICSPTWWTT